jgi:hypothetical protein
MDLILVICAILGSFGGVAGLIALGRKDQKLNNAITSNVLLKEKVAELSDKVIAIEVRCPDRIASFTGEFKNNRLTHDEIFSRVRELEKTVPAIKGEVVKEVNESVQNIFIRALNRIEGKE